MKKIFKNLLKLNFYNGIPLKYREANYTLSELEKRLSAEINRHRQYQPAVLVLICTYFTKNWSREW